jgi:hypothetical protein
LPKDVRRSTVAADAGHQQFELDFTAAGGYSFELVIVNNATLRQQARHPMYTVVINIFAAEVE